MTNWAGVPVAANKLPPALRDRYRHYSFESFDRRGAYAYSTVGEWAELTQTAMSRLRPAIRRLSDAGLAITEWDTTNSLAVNWRDKGLGTLTQQHDLVVSDADQANWLRPALRKKGMIYAGWIRQQSIEDLQAHYRNATVPTRRGKGAPYWFSGGMPHAAEALGRLTIEATGIDDLDHMLITSGGAQIKPCLTLDVRYQSSKKARPDYLLVGSELEEVGEKFRPKARKIQALPFAYNYPAVGVAAVMKAAMRGTSPRHDGTVNHAMKLAANYAHVFATDLSTYDETISYETDAAWRDLVLRPVVDALLDCGLIRRLQARLILEIHEKISTIDSLCPPVRTDEGARMVRTRGTNKSGQRFTSQEATDINDCRIRQKALDLGLEIGWTNLGDDTLIGCNDPEAEQEWNGEKANNYGFKETAAPDATFLMKRIPGGYGYVSRMLMACINREVRHEPFNVFAAASGISVRRALLRGNPLAPTFEEVLEACRGPLHDAYRLSIVNRPEQLLIMQMNTLPKGDTNAKDDLIQIIDAAWLAGELSNARREKLVAATSIVGQRTEMRYYEMEREIRDMPLQVATRYIAKHAYHPQ